MQVPHMITQSGQDTLEPLLSPPNNHVQSIGLYQGLCIFSGLQTAHLLQHNPGKVLQLQSHMFPSTLLVSITRDFFEEMQEWKLVLSLAVSPFSKISSFLLNSYPSYSSIAPSITLKYAEKHC